ncbi:MAG: ATP-binding protein, partial [Pseudomonadota bacterium]
MLDQEKSREQLINELEQLRRLVAARSQFEDRLRGKERELLQSEETLRLLIEHAPIAMIVTSGLKQNVEIVNREFTKLFGYTKEDVPDIAHWWPLAYPEKNRWQESAALWNQKVDAAIKSESQIEPVKTIVKCKDGRRRHIEVRFSSIGLRNIVFFTDFTKRLLAEEETLRTKALLDSIIQNLPTGVFVKEADGLTFTLWNKTCEDLYGFRAAEMLGKTAMGTFTEEESSRFEAQDRLVLTSGRLMEVQEQEVFTRDKGVRILRSKKVPIIDEKGKPTHVVGISEDITELKITEKQLISARETAEQASRAKSSFLANMSHEIRTPMNGIIGMTELALNTDLSPEQREYLEAVKISAESLLRLINDILDFSKIEAGKFELVEMDFSLRDSIAQAMIAVSLQAHSKDLELVYHIPPQIPDIVVGDPGRLNQILINLLGNAIKFTHQGEVAVDIRMESESEDEVNLHFAVRDTGIGIPEDKRQKIFKAFEQADGSTTRKYGGTGLGLAVSTQLVQMMGGQMWLESEVAKGSTFHFTTKLGLSQGPLPQKASVDFYEFRDLPVLIVDDNAMNRFVLKEIFTYWGMKPVAVESATDALKAMKNAAAFERPFSLVML